MIAWHETAPHGWQRHRLKWCFEACRNGIWGEEPDGENDIIVVRVADFDRAAFRVRLGTPTLRAVSVKERDGRLLRNGDLLIEKSGGGEQQPVGVVVSYDHDAPAVCSNFVARLVHIDSHYPRYLVYLNSFLYDNRVNTKSINQTTGIQNLDSEAYLDEYVAVPPLETQRRIAADLDRETGRIDALIAAKERLLALLAEKRQALITHAVTRGLNPHAPLQDSGFPWLGEIPAHWSIHRLKFHMPRIEQGWSPQCDNFPADENEWGVLKVGAVNGWEFNPNENKRFPDELEPLVEYEIHDGDVLMSRANTTQLLGRAALVRDVRPRLMFCDKHYRLTLNPDVLNSEFLVLYLRSTAGHFEFERDATGASNSMQNIGQDSVKNVWITVPPPSEQRDIARYVHVTTARMDAMESANRRTLDLLRERRSALIAAAVTGQLEVEA